MGFNIGRFIGSIAPTLGKAVGTAFGGIVGGQLGGAVGTGVQQGLVAEPEAIRIATVGRATQPSAVFGGLGGPQFSGGGTFLPSSIGPVASLGAIGRGAAILSPLLTIPFLGGGNGKNPIQVILAKARAATGGPVTRNKIIDAAKACGLETAAATFGIDLREVCLVIVKGRTRRRRGVSAADIRRTKRTINFASKVRKDLKALAR